MSILSKSPASLFSDLQKNDSVIGAPKFQSASDLTALFVTSNSSSTKQKSAALGPSMNVRRDSPAAAVAAGRWVSGRLGVVAGRR
ncbi:hypothetical protein GWI33_009269 [Rhynchophorus ferrugineus]|uniref:Uncharacterized protein n=1 Tax=Rhynchophorus ferrugineus TaxID=354439 RepID=A0A834IPM2_RHYFE|nr:hypothetical protein GWI33_009269 [Rhynchophorus ferrugineus]